MQNGPAQLVTFARLLPCTTITAPNNSTNTRNLLLGEVAAIFCLGDVLMVLIGCDSLLLELFRAGSSLPTLVSYLFKHRLTLAKLQLTTLPLSTFIDFSLRALLET